MAGTKVPREGSQDTARANAERLPHQSKAAVAASTSVIQAASVLETVAGYIYMLVGCLFIGAVFRFVPASIAAAQAEAQSTQGLPGVPFSATDNSASSLRTHLTVPPVLTAAVVLAAVSCSFASVVAGTVLLARAPKFTLNGMLPIVCALVALLSVPWLILFRQFGVPYLFVAAGSVVWLMLMWVTLRFRRQADAAALRHSIARVVRLPVICLTTLVFVAFFSLVCVLACLVLDATLSRALTSGITVMKIISVLSLIFVVWTWLGLRAVLRISSAAAVAGTSCTSVRIFTDAASYLADSKYTADPAAGVPRTTLSTYSGVAVLSGLSWIESVLLHAPRIFLLTPIFELNNALSGLYRIWRRRQLKKSGASTVSVTECACAWPKWLLNRKHAATAWILRSSPLSWLFAGVYGRSTLKMAGDRAVAAVHGNAASNEIVSTAYVSAGFFNTIALMGGILAASFASIPVFMYAGTPFDERQTDTVSALKLAYLDTYLRAFAIAYAVVMLGTDMIRAGYTVCVASASLSPIEFSRARPEEAALMREAFNGLS